MLNNLGTYEIDVEGYTDIATAIGETLTDATTYQIQIVSSTDGKLKYCQKDSTPDEAEGNILYGTTIYEFTQDSTYAFYVKNLTGGLKINISEVVTPENNNG